MSNQTANKPESHLERAFALQLRTSNLPPPEREYRFAPPRRFRFDFAWPSLMIAVEIEGGTWTRGGHTRGSGYASDCDKYNLAASLGWRVLRFTTNDIGRYEGRGRNRTWVDNLKAVEAVEKLASSINSGDAVNKPNNGQAKPV